MNEDIKADIRKALSTGDPLDLVNWFMMRPEGVTPLGGYWLERFCAVSEVLQESMQLEKLLAGDRRLHWLVEHGYYVTQDSMSGDTWFVVEHEGRGETTVISEGATPREAIDNGMEKSA